MTQPHQIDKQGIRMRARAAIVRDGAILLVAFDDENGFHYNLPGGGVEPGETLYGTAIREVREETTADVEVKELLLVYECFPPDYGNYNGDHSLNSFFAVSYAREASHVCPIPRMQTRLRFTGFPSENFPTHRWYQKSSVGLSPPCMNPIEMHSA